MRTWFVVLPDAPAARPIMKALRGCQASLPRVVDHASGRPWLVGAWQPHELQLVAAGPARIAAFGDCPAQLDSRLLPQNVGGVDVLDAAAAHLPGAHHLVCSADGRVRMQGTLAQTRRVFHATVRGCTVAADRADVLAALTGAGLDDAAVVLRMLYPPAPHPLGEAPLWRGVSSVPGTDYLVLDPDGRGRVAARWRPPAPNVPIGIAAEPLRDTLVRAVTARSSVGGTVSADMSGGLDSTSLCFLVPQDQARLVTYRLEMSNPAQDDPMWARSAMAALPAAVHVVKRAGEVPMRYADIADAVADPEEPYFLTSSRGWLRAAGLAMAAMGSRVHFSGHGGDELFERSPVALRSLARTRPVAALRQLRDVCALYRWPLAPTLAAWADHRDYAGWLAAQANSLVAPSQPAYEDAFQWAALPRLPEWATKDAAALASERIRAVAGRVDPLAATREQHRRLSVLQASGRMFRLAGRLMKETGPPLATPYLDDHVIAAALAVDPRATVDSRAYKPLLRQAMQGIVPDRLLGRGTSDEFSEDVHAGFTRHRPALLEMLEDSLLAERGLIDAAAMRAALQRPLRVLWPVDATLSVEQWLRTVPVTSAAFEGSRC